MLRPPAIEAQPGHQRAITGEPVTFHVAVSGTAPLVFRWRQNGTNLLDHVKVKGASTDTLTLLNPQTADMGRFSVSVSNIYGSIISAEAVLTVWPVAAWGNNAYGQIEIPPGLSNAVKVVAGAFHSLALLRDRTLRGWGAGTISGGPSPHFGQAITLPLSNVTDVAAGYYHNIAIQQDGHVIAWGAGETNAGVGFDYGQSQVPPTLSNVIQVAGGQCHSVALQSDGTVAAWGAGNTYSGFAPHFGQSAIPPGLSGVVAVAAGRYHTLALKADGTVAAWGAGTNYGTQPHFGQAILPPGLSNAVAIAAGAYHSVALKADGTVVVWGQSGAGQADVPADLTSVAAIASGFSHVAAIKSDGTLITWGLGSAGQTDVPELIRDVFKVTAGSQHTIVLQSEGEPHITVQPWSRSVGAGTSVTLVAMALGQGPLSYQWQRDGQELPGATNPTFTLEHASYSHQGIYRVLVSNRVGSVLSAPAALSLKGGALVVDIMFTNGKVMFSWDAFPGEHYQLQVRETLEPGDWSSVGPVVTATGNSATVTDDRHLGGMRFYRVQLLP